MVFVPSLWHICFAKSFEFALGNIVQDSYPFIGKVESPDVRR